jgi:hypothetical protein
MFDRRPTQEVLSWVSVVLWSALIFATVPFVRLVTDQIDDDWEVYLFTYGVAVGTIVAAAIGIYLIRRRRSVLSHVVLSGVAALIVFRTFELSSRNPVEAIHFLQYGFLSLLLYWAFSHRIGDYSVYAAAAAGGMIVGMIDETVQWLTPGRHFGMRDIWLNCSAVALMQVALAGGIRPRIISGWPGPTSLRRLCHLLAAAVAYLGLIHLNTADRIARYAPYIPFVAADQVPMVEYGYLHRPAANIWFRSRLTADDLRESARRRAKEASRILDEYRGRYSEFLKAYGPGIDPFLHEAGVHLFGRDTNLELARAARDTEERDLRFTIAFWENMILEEYFGEVLRHSSYRWPEEIASEVERNAPPDRGYESRVSEDVITRMDERTLSVLLWSCVVLLVAAGLWLRRRERSGTADGRRPGGQERAG